MLIYFHSAALPAIRILVICALLTLPLSQAHLHWPHTGCRPPPNIPDGVCGSLHGFLERRRRPAHPERRHQRRHQHHCGAQRRATDIHGQGNTHETSATLTPGWRSPGHPKPQETVAFWISGGNICGWHRCHLPDLRPHEPGISPRLAAQAKETW